LEIIRRDLLGSGTFRKTSEQGQTAVDSEEGALTIEAEMTLPKSVPSSSNPNEDFWRPMHVLLAPQLLVLQLLPPQPAATSKELIGDSCSSWVWYCRLLCRSIAAAAPFGAFSEARQQ
jgi:hypothetical protein